MEPQELGHRVALGPLEVDVRAARRCGRGRAAAGRRGRSGTAGVTPGSGPGSGRAAPRRGPRRSVSKSEGSVTVDLDEDDVVLVGQVVVGDGSGAIFSRYSSASPASGSLAISRILRRAQSRRNRSAVASSSTRWPAARRRGASREAQRDRDDRGDEAGADLDAVGPLDDVGDRGVDEDRGDDARSRRSAALRRRRRAASVTATRGRGHQHQDAGGVGAALGVDVGVEDPGDRGTRPR